MIENGERLVSAVIFCDVALLVDAIEAHAGDAHDEAAVPVEGHAERPSADMGVDFPPDMIGREEADDLALPHAAIEVVVVIEDDVLGTVDLAEANDLDVAQAVVHRVGRRGVVEPRRGRQGEIGRRHIDLGAQTYVAICPIARRWRWRAATRSRPPSRTRRSRVRA